MALTRHTDRVGLKMIIGHRFGAQARSETSSPAFSRRLYWQASHVPSALLSRRLLALPRRRSSSIAAAAPIACRWPIRRSLRHSCCRRRTGSAPAAARPGSHYWQNHADYDIAASLDTATKTLRGQLTLRYTNNSPDTLHYIWLQTEQNAFKSNSLNSFIFPPDSRFGAQNFEGGDVIDHLDQVVAGAAKAAGAAREAAAARQRDDDARSTSPSRWRRARPRRSTSRGTS